MHPLIETETDRCWILDADRTIRHQPMYISRVAAAAAADAVISRPSLLVSIPGTD